jgi:hypothetical protein
LIDVIGFIVVAAVPLGTLWYNFRGEFTAELAWYEKFGLGAGAFGLLVIIFLITFWKYISPKIKANPDLWAINLLLTWGVIYGIIFMIYTVINQLNAVAISGMIGAFAACLFNVAAYCVKHYGKEK